MNFEVKMLKREAIIEHLDNHLKPWLDAEVLLDNNFLITSKEQTLATKVNSSMHKCILWGKSKHIYILYINFYYFETSNH